MPKLRYEDHVKVLREAVDIAIDSLKRFPPKSLNEAQLNHVVQTYGRFKERLLNPLPQYKNSKSVAYLREDILTYFQEGTEETIQVFWQEIKKSDIKIFREDKVVKILKRKKIKSEIEYDFVIDVLVAYRQEGLITDADVNNLNNMIAEFERSAAPR